MPTVCSKEVVAKIVLIIGSKSPILQSLQEFEALLKAENLIDYVVVSVEKLMTHMSSRAKLGVNPHEVHRLGDRVAGIGVKLDELDVWCAVVVGCYFVHVCATRHATDLC